MGKIRVNTIGDEKQEAEQKQNAEKRRAIKKEAKEPEETKVENVILASDKEARPESKEDAGQASMTKTPKDKKVPASANASAGKQKKTSKKARGKKYQAVRQLVDKSKTYPLSDALSLLDKTHLATFDETVELHINTLSTGISGTMNLPHGTGKKTKVVILAPSKDAAGADALLKEIESGKISFDVLIATPDAMPRLAKVARILGPKGLMPNPKNGTVTPKPEELAAKYEGGQTSFKTELKAPVLHLTVGKLSFGKDKLSENIKAALDAVKVSNIRNVTLKSTMSPGVKLQVNK